MKVFFLYETEGPQRRYAISELLTQLKILSGMSEAKSFKIHMAREIIQNVYYIWKSQRLYYISKAFVE